jgi:hypothetical protein
MTSSAVEIPSFSSTMLVLSLTGLEFPRRLLSLFKKSPPNRPMHPKQVQNIRKTGLSAPERGLEGGAKGFFNRLTTTNNGGNGAAP